MNIKAIAKKIKLLILDVDGVFTNGQILFLPTGEEAIFFNIQDGYGIKALQKSGVIVAVISGRRHPAVVHRLNQLGIEHYFLGEVNKIPAYETLLKKLAISPDMIAYMGDDLPDMPVMQKIALPIAVANALPAVKKIAHYCTEKKGGDGAIREVCDLILDAQNET